MTGVGPLFGPGALTWDVLRQPIYLLGGIRALLLQLGEPKIAAAVADHSDFVNGLFPRLQHTIDLMVIVGMGDPDEAQAALERTHRVHGRVHGTLEDGAPYHAHDPELKLWVLATLIDTVLAVEERYLGEFDEEARCRYYQESREVACLFGIPEALIPPDLDSFRTYMGQRLASLEMSDPARQLSNYVVRPRFRFVPPFLFAPLRPVAADLLPPRLRAAYGLSFTSRQRRFVRWCQVVSRAVVPRLPGWVRTFPLLHPLQGACRFGPLAAKPRSRSRGPITPSASCRAGADRLRDRLSGPVSPHER